MQNNLQNNFAVQIEETPNPATLKFKFSQPFCQHTQEFLNVEATDNSPLAAKIFGFPWVSSAMIGPDFISVTKQDWVEWSVLGKPLSGLLLEHVNSGAPIFVERKTTSHSDESDILTTDSEVVKKIKTILKNEIRPVVALDGGDIAFHSYVNQVLYVQMKGACSGCPSSQATLKEGIEVRLKQALPEIISVESV